MFPELRTAYFQELIFSDTLLMNCQVQQLMRSVLNKTIFSIDTYFISEIPPADTRPSRGIPALQNGHSWEV